MAQLHDEEKKPIKLDALYVDTTFQGVSYETFPKRSETMDSVVREIEKWLASGDTYRVALVPSARYGYEYVFNEIYKRMDMKVYVEINWEKHCGSCYTDRAHKYLYINFSAMMWRRFKPEDQSVVPSSEDGKMFVCFATHCSRTELIHFIEYLAPKKVVGFSEPYSYTPSKEPSTLTPLKIRTPKRSAKKLEGDKPKKVPKHVLKQLFE
ncbi:putative Artemis protein [Operophtera brumata]|uniref:Protein artemis n=1 Tax=Operophtera brumata TaxID=104452 RepID=A0A0L7K357_OPEBR|nr:putative Artemis protein [Operophtera brumata]